MANRVSDLDVEQLTGTTMSCTNIGTWVSVANSIINSRLECINGTDALLEQIELQLSSHFVTMVDGKSNASVTQEKTDMISTSYAKAIINESINETVYGRAANALSGGCLVDYDKQKIFLATL